MNRPTWEFSDRRHEQLVDVEFEHRQAGFGHVALPDERGEFTEGLGPVADQIVAEFLRQDDDQSLRALRPARHHGVEAIEIRR